MSAPRKRPAPSASGGASKKAKKKGRKKATATKPDEMSAEVLEFIQAIDDYKRLQGRPFPSWSEILEILKGLGYDKSPR